jgi:hypothetical protein
MLLTTHPDADVQFNVLTAFEHWFARITIRGTERNYFIGHCSTDEVVLFPADDRANRTGDAVTVDPCTIDAVHIF